MSAEAEDPSVTSEHENFVPNEWRDPVPDSHLKFNFSGAGGIKDEYVNALKNSTPLDYFLIFLNDEVLDLIVEGTNWFAQQNVSEDGTQWTPTTKEEIKKFLGLMGYMGVSIYALWSPVNAHVVMTEKRFEELLKNLHFTTTCTFPKNNPLCKIDPLLNLFNDKFQEVYTPEELFSIDWTTYPFNRLKIFKVTSDNGYIWNMKIYRKKPVKLPIDIALQMSQKLLNSGRTAFTDNFFTSIKLANKLLDNQTHLLGVLKLTKSSIPSEVARAKVNTSAQVFGKENNRGICVMKWGKDKCNLFLSTKYSTEMVRVEKRSKTVRTPKAIAEFNNVRKCIDSYNELLEQLYESAVCNEGNTKWYVQVANEILFGTAILNAFVLHKTITNSKMRLIDFRLEVVRKLMGLEGRAGEENSQEESFSDYSSSDDSVLDDLLTTGKKRDYPI